MGQIRAGGGERGGMEKECTIIRVYDPRNESRISQQGGLERRSSTREKSWTGEVAAEGAGDIFESV